MTISGGDGFQFTYVKYTSGGIGWADDPSNVQVYDLPDWGSDSPLLLKNDPISGYRWQWFTQFDRGVFSTQWFDYPVCPTSIDNGGLCVYELNTGSTEWQWLSAQFNGKICSIKAGDC